MLEWQRDWGRKKHYDAVLNIMRDHAGAYGQGIEYAYTMVHAELRRRGAAAERDATSVEATMSSQSKEAVELILQNGRFTTLNPALPEASAVAVRGGRFVHVGTERSVESLRSVATRVIDLGGRRVIPGLNDSHTHVIRGGLTYNAGVALGGSHFSRRGPRALAPPSCSARRPPQWGARGRWLVEFQFKERRMPTLEEINEAAPDTPVFVLHLYSRALLNRAALRALGYDESLPPPPAFDRGSSSNATPVARQGDGDADSQAERPDPLPVRSARPLRSRSPTVSTRRASSCAS